MDLNLGEVSIPHPKEKRPKKVFLLPQDVEILKSFPRGMPGLYFFRHLKGRSAVKAGQRFGEKYLYKWWMKACQNLGIKGVDLYDGTRHSSVRDLRKNWSPEQIRMPSMHSTNRASKRYYQVDPDDLRKIYSDTEIRRKPSKRFNLKEGFPIERYGLGARAPRCLT